jgi:arylsulfatase A-like enzyme
VNILLVTLDQFRGDCLSCAGHPVVRTPNLDRLAAEGVRLARHYSQSAPCSPGRASLYTGMYQSNHRVVANGTPLDDRFDNLARMGVRAGYRPTLFGYTDQSVDPRQTSGPNDPRLAHYEGVLPGFEVGLELNGADSVPWTAWLRSLGHDVSDDLEAAQISEPDRPADHSLTAFLTNQLLDWIPRQDGPWFAHISHFRPHPPYAAAGEFARMYDPATIPAPIAVSKDRHKLHDGLMRHPLMAAPTDPEEMAKLQAQYFGMVSEVDHQMGRVWQALEASGQWDNTLIIVTADHGEQLGDHGMVQKAGFFDQSYHILGLVRDPRQAAGHGSVVESFTENVDLFPTLCDALGQDVPHQCDGLPLTPFLKAEAPPHWRDAAHWEFDWRYSNIPRGPHHWPWDRRLERQNLAVLRTHDTAYVHFGDGTWLCFDLAADPTWRTGVTDPSVILAQAQAMLTWKAQIQERTLTGLLIENGGIGRWPQMPQGWGEETS